MSLRRHLFVSFPAAVAPSGELLPRIIPALARLRQAGFRCLAVCRVPDLSPAQVHTLGLLESQGAGFDEVLRCPHRAGESCQCGGPGVGLVMPFLVSGVVDAERSAVIGDGVVDRELAGLLNVEYVPLSSVTWESLARDLVLRPRRARVLRETRETRVEVEVGLPGEEPPRVKSGLGYFDHMLEQLAKHGGFDLRLEVRGDLGVDEHHTVEDTALAIGEALRRALGDKIGIGRYGFVLPMDEAEARIAIDLSGRAYSVFRGKFERERVGELPTELVPHFFRSLADGLGATLHIEVTGENAHHMVESIFKGVGRALRPALQRGESSEVPSTKGVL